MVRRLLLILLLSQTCASISALGAKDLPSFDFDEKKINLLEPPTLPTIIDIGISLLQVVSIEPVSQENPKITAQFKVQAHWQDDRLRASPENLHEVHAFHDADAQEKMNRIFAPRVAISEGTTHIDHQHLHIFGSGLVTLSQVVTVATPAKMQLKHFPFDSQIFKFRFASTYWDENEIDLILNPLETSLWPNASPISWSIDYAGYNVTKSSVRTHSEIFYVFNFMVHAERDPRNLLWRLLLPLIAIVILSWNVFWMYEDSTSALGNCFVFLLTVVAFHQIANDLLPSIPVFTFLDAIVFISYGFIIIPTFQVMITTKLERQGKTREAERIRRFCRFFVPISFMLTMLTTMLGYFAT